MTTALEGGEGSASRSGRSLPTGKSRYPLYRRLGGPQGRSGQVREISSPPGFDPRTAQPVASRYTDYAYPPLPMWRVRNKTVWLVISWVVVVVVVVVVAVTLAKVMCLYSGSILFVWLHSALLQFTVNGVWVVSAVPSFERSFMALRGRE